MTALRQTIAKVLSLPPSKVLDGETSNNVTTKAPYVVVRLVSTKEHGASSVYDGDKETETITASCTSVISINFYGNNSRSMALFAKSSLRTQTSVQLFNKIGVSVLQCTDSLSLPTSLSSGLEQRAQFDMTIGHNQIVVNGINRIDEQPIIFEVNQ